MKCHSVLRSLILLIVLCLTKMAVAQVATTGEAPPPSDDTPVVKLLDPGQQPRTPLRFKIEKGLRQTMVMEIKMEMSMEMGGQKLPIPQMPAQRMTMEVAVSDVSAAGETTYDFKFTGIELTETENSPAAVVDAMKKAMKPLEGMSGAAVITNRGIVEKADFRVPDNVEPSARQILDSMQQSVKQLSDVLPEEAVGPGAKWQVTYKISSGGVKMAQVATNELVSIQGDVAKIKTTIVQKAESQDVQAPGVPAGIKMRLVGLKSNGSGESTLSLRKLIPQAAKMDLNSDFNMEIGDGDQKQAINMQLKMDVQVSDKAKASK
jgi:hypothetical protein